MGLKELLRCAGIWLAVQVFWLGGLALAARWVPVLLDPCPATALVALVPPVLGTAWLARQTRRC